jgi:hypothetical protein
MSNISSEEAVALTARVCPKTESGEIAKKLISIEMIDGCPNKWANAAIDSILNPLFDVAKQSSKAMIVRTMDSDQCKYGADRDELGALLVGVNNKMEVFCEVITHIATVHEVMRDKVSRMKYKEQEA